MRVRLGCFGRFAASAAFDILQRWSYRSWV